MRVRPSYYRLSINTYPISVPPDAPAPGPLHRGLPAPGDHVPVLVPPLQRVHVQHVPQPRVRRRRAPADDRRSRVRMVLRLLLDRRTPQDAGQRHGRVREGKAQLCTLAMPRLLF